MSITSLNITPHYYTTVATGQGLYSWLQDISACISPRELKVPDMIHNITPPPPIFFKPTLILVPKVLSYFSDFCGDI